MLLSDGRELVFRLRVHPRARGVKLSVSGQAGMVVTIPPRFDRSRIARILEQKRNWIERSLRTYPMTPSPYRLPERIVLPAIAEEWAIDYEAGDPGHVRLSQQRDGRLHVSGAIDRPEAVRVVLGRWLLRQGRRHLVPWLRRAAGELGFPVARVVVRLQRTLWGSCSHGNTISLNARLLLIPPRLVRHVLIHELVHTRHRNHSPEFWQALAVHVPDYRRERVELKRLWAELPI